jgi:hypothetical protein
MTLAASGYKFKKDLKASIGKPLSYQETSMFGAEYMDNGSFVVVGPSAHVREWFAKVTMKDGIIEEVE